MPSFTYRRMADIAAWLLLKPHFCDVDEETLACDAAAVRPCINGNTSLIVAVHPIVDLCDIGGIIDLAKEGMDAGADEIQHRFLRCGGSILAGSEQAAKRIRGGVRDD